MVINKGKKEEKMIKPALNMLKHKPKKPHPAYEYAVGLFVFAVFMVFMLYFSSMTGNIVVGVPNATTESDLVKVFETSGVKPKVIVGYQLDPESIEKLNITMYTPFLKISCVKDMCINNIFYKCENGQPATVESCKYGCDEQGCFECVQWINYPKEAGLLAPKIKGQLNKCIGSDVYRCINGRWKFTATCEFGCISSPILERNPSINKQAVDEYLGTGASSSPRDLLMGFVGNKQRLLARPPRKYLPRFGEEQAENITVGHCRCHYGYDNICVEDDLYQCLGYKDDYFYTKIQSCAFGCEDGKCLKRRKTCDMKDNKRQICLAGTLWMCKDGSWINTHDWCEIGKQYDNPGTKQNQHAG